MSQQSTHQPKSLAMNAKQAAQLLSSITNLSVIPDEMPEFLDSALHGSGVEAASLKADNLYLPEAIRRIHAHLVPARAGFLEQLTHDKLPPVVVGHYKKGGTGKTTTLSNTAIALAQQGLRVLFIDADPQGTSTTLFGVDIEDPTLRTLQHVIFGHSTTSGQPVPLEAAILPLYSDAVLDLIPSDIELSSFDRVAYPRSNRERLFAKFLNANADKLSFYDVILVDTNPGTNLLNFNLMVPAEFILMPISLDVPSMKSMRLMASEALELDEVGACPKTMLIVPNVFHTTMRHSRESLEALRRSYPNETFKTVVPAYAGVSRQGWASDRGRTLIEREPSVVASKRLAQLALEMAERVLWEPIGATVLEFTESEGRLEEAAEAASV